MSITVRRSEDDEDALEVEVEAVEVEAGGTIESPIWIGSEPESTPLRELEALVDPLLLPSRMRPKFPHMVEAV